MLRPIHFEISAYVMFILTTVWIAVKYRGQRDYWYALIGCTLLFPFEYIADKYWMFLDYDWGFVMMADRFPLMMPFSYGWFFALPLILCLRSEKRIDAWPLMIRIAVLYVIFFFWDLGVEYNSTSFHLWDYHWKKEVMLGGFLPWFIPVIVSSANVSLYFVHKFAVKKSNDKSWFHGLSIHVAAYYALFAIQGTAGWFFIKIFVRS